MIKMRQYGDWAKAGAALTALAVDLNPELIATLDAFGDLFIERMREHIDNQDLGWVPLSETTIELKNGNDTIYVETGELKANFEVRKIKSSKNNYSIFIGASPYRTHSPSGEPMSKIMIWLEYGTDIGTPPRPLVRPTWEELEPLIKEELYAVIPKIIKR